VIVEEILLDTTVRLRFLFEPECLRAGILERIADGRSRIWFICLNLWEIAIKQALRRDEFDFAPEKLLKTSMAFRQGADGVGGVLVGM
jgi:hypothetical protein